MAARPAARYTLSMSITIEIDEAVWRAVERATDIHSPTELVHRLMEREIRLRAAQGRLADAGGSMPDLEIPPRRRPEPERI